MEINEQSKNIKSMAYAHTDYEHIQNEINYVYKQSL